MLALVATLITSLALATPGLAAAQVSQTIPTVYEAGHFYAVPETIHGQKLRLLVDTGGGGGNGMYWITPKAAKRLDLKTHSCTLDDSTVTVADVPRYKPGHGLPPPIKSPCGEAMMVYAAPNPGNMDGQLGAGYLPGRAWTFDYPARRLSVQGASWRPSSSAHAAKLGLDGGFARVTIRVAGKPIQMLLDTGATAHPTPAGENASHMPTVNGYGVTSYIDQSVFMRWHKAHPKWRVIANGDSLYGPKIIEVPRVIIAGWSVGPIWFTVQHMAAYMSQYTDRPIKGALGANVFRHFIMTVDYPRSTAYFQCALSCQPAASQPPVR